MESSKNFGDALRLFHLYITTKKFFSPRNKSSLLQYNGVIKGISNSYFTHYKGYQFFMSFAAKGISEKKFLRLCAIAYHVKGESYFIADMTSNEVIEQYKNFEHYIQNYKELLKRDLHSIENPFSKGNNFPRMYEMFCSKRVSLPTILCAERIFGFLKRFDKSSMNIGQRLVWQNTYTKLIKLDEFLFDDVIKR